MVAFLGWDLHFVKWSIDVGDEKVNPYRCILQEKEMIELSVFSGWYIM